MFIKEILNQNRRDFKAIYKCENCNHEIEKRGYDDRNFHDNVVPGFKCPECGKSREDLGIKQPKTQTKYPEGFQV